MEGTTNVLDNTNVLSAIERLSNQVQQLQTIVNSQQTSSRRTVTLEEHEGSGDDGGSESRRDNKGRHEVALDDTHLKQLGFKALKTNSTLYTRGVKQDKILLAVYVDDVLIVGR